MLGHGWSNEIETWKAIPKGMPDSKEWVVLPFSNSILELITTSSGVYIIFLESPYHSSKNLTFSTPLYTGLASNLKARFNDHSRDNDRNNLFNKIRESLDFQRNRRNVKIFYSYVIIKEYSLLRACEQYLINIYGPVYNKINSIGKAKKHNPRIDATLGNR